MLIFWGLSFYATEHFPKNGAKLRKERISDSAEYPAMGYDFSMSPFLCEQ